MLRSSRAELELAEEVELHRTLAAQRLEHDGCDAEAARQQSHRRMGNVALAREDSRAVWIAPWLENLRRDIAYAFRVVVRQPGFAAAMILVMGLGIGAITGVFGLIDSLVLKSLPVREPERLVYLKDPAFSYPIFSDVRARGAHLFEDVLAWDIDRLSVEWTEALEPVDVLLASGSFFSTLGVTAAVGDMFGPSDDKVGGGDRGLVAVISDAAWQQRYAADPSIVGRPVRVGRHVFTIIGVAPRGFFGVAAGLAPELMIPLTTLSDEATLRSGSTSWIHVMARLREGITLTQANAAFVPVWQATLDATTSPGMPPERRSIFLGRRTELLSAQTGYSRVRRQFESPLWILLGLVGLLLAVACASAANMLLARGMGRRRELVVRLAIGASRGRLIRQMLIEAFVWTLLGAGAGLTVAWWATHGLVRMMATSSEAIVLDVAPNERMLPVSFLLTLLSTAVSALVPALRATRLDAGHELKSHTPIGGLLRRASLGNTLVAIQIALTVVLLTTAVLFSRSLDRILGRDAGFNREGLLVVWTDPLAAGYDGDRLFTFYQALLDRLRQLPSVASASLSWYPPISDDNGSWTQSIAVDGVEKQDRVERQVYFNAISPGYMQTMEMRLLRGRDFTDRDVNGSAKVVLLNESLARRLFGGGEAIGRKVTIGRNASRKDLEVVGIVQDAKYQRLQEPSRNIAYLPCAQLAELFRGANLVAEVRSRANADVRAEISRQVRQLDARVPLRLETVTDRISESIVRERVLALLAATLGLTALALACAAVFGLMAFVVSRRTNEIGLRMALGAAPREMLANVLAQSTVVALVGIALALPLIVWLGRYVTALIFEVTPLDLPSIVAASLIMLTVAAAAALIPAVRAARIDPASALKAE